MKNLATKNTTHVLLTKRGYEKMFKKLSKYQYQRKRHNMIFLSEDHFAFFDCLADKKTYYNGVSLRYYTNHPNQTIRQRAHVLWRNKYG